MATAIVSGLGLARANRTRVGVAGAWAALFVLVMLAIAPASASAAQSRVPYTATAGGAAGAILRSDGTVWTYGNGSTGVLGNGTNTNPQLTPVRVELSAGVPLDRVVQVVSGFGHMCALRAQGTVWCWGDNGEGRLGDGTTTSRNRPVRVETAAGVALSGVVQIQTGLDYTMALLANGEVWSWGRNTDGQLGDGTLTNRSRPVQATYASDSSPVTRVVALGGGWAHSSVLRADGTVWAWGANADGQLGDGSTTRRTRAVQAQTSAGAPLTDVVDVSAMGNQTVTLRADGSVWTFGDNAWGQLSDGTTTDRPRAVAAVTLSGAAVRARAIHGGQYNTYWVQQDGTVYAAGYGGWSSNGDGTTTSRSSAVQVTDTSGAALTGVVRVDGQQSGVAVKADGTVWAWGYNPDGRSGTGATGDLPRATLLGTDRGSGWTAVAPGGSHTVALRADGTVWAWGANGSGQLGIGSTGTGVDGPPLQVTMSGGGALTQVVDVVSGTDHSLALRADGSVWAWGAGSAGQLGDGSTTAAATQAVQVTASGGAALAGAKGIAAGGASSYALLADGTAVAWGAGSGGQLASGALADQLRAAPVRATGGSTLSMLQALDAGRHAGVDGFALFLRANGEVWASGANDSGQLGDGTTTRRDQAVQAREGSGAVLTSISHVAAGGRFSLARRPDGTLAAWGDNSTGQLGDGTTTSRGFPKPVTTSGGTSLQRTWRPDAGASHAITVVGGGELRSWGAGAAGQVGDGSTSTRTTAVATVTASGASVSTALAAAGDDHTGAVVTDPAGAVAFAVMSTGQDASGQLGDCGRGGFRTALVLLASTCPATVNDGTGSDVDGQVSVTTITANWDGHVDQTLVRYDYCIATATSATGCTGTILVGWTSNGTSTSVSHGGLALSVNSTYYVCARLVRATTLAPVCSDGVTVDDSAPAVPTLVSPADGASVAVADLTASYSDTYTSGVIEVQACADTACTSVVATAQSPVVASGTDGTARPVLAQGSYHWRARAIDAAGNASGWTTTRAFSYNAVPVATAISPSDGAWIATRQPALVVQHDDADGGSGTLTVEVCASAVADPWSTNCSSGYQLARTGDLAVAAGSRATLSPNGTLADGTWHWRARSADALGATSSWTTTRSFRVDATAPSPVPDVSMTRKGTGRIDVSWTASTDAGVGGLYYEVDRYDASTSSWGELCPDTTSLSCSVSGLGGDEILVVRVRACDSLGNCTSWSGASAVANSGYLLRSTTSTNLNNVQSRAALLPPGGTLNSSSTGVRLPAGNSAGRVGQFPFRYGQAANQTKIVMDTTAPIDPQDTVSGWGWVVDDVESKALSAGTLEVTVTTHPAAGASGSGTGRVVCRLWRAVTNGSTSFVSWQHLADANGSVADVMTADGAGPTTSTCDLSAALGSQLTFSADEVVYVELILDATVAGTAGDQYMLWFNDASSAINMPKPGTPPSTPVPVAPAGGATTGEAPTLTASYSHPTGAQGSLEMQVSTDSTFATGVLELATPPVASGADGSADPGTLALGTTWYWRVRARDTAGLVSAWSSTVSFRTSTAPAAPVPSSPSDGAALSEGSVTLQAGAFSDVDAPSDSHAASQWQVSAAGSDWSVLAADSGVTTTSLTSWATPALGAGSWQWRVRYRDQYGVWSSWSNVANPRSFTMSASSSSISLSTTALELGLLATGGDTTGSLTITASTSNATGYSLSMTDGSDSSFLSCGCGDAIADWTGSDGTPSTWSAGTSGYAGLTVRDAPGGRLAKWGTGTGTAEADHVANRYAGLKSSSSVVLHTTGSASPAAGVVATFRANPSTSTAPGSYSETVVVSIVANP